MLTWYSKRSEWNLTLLIVMLNNLIFCIVSFCFDKYWLSGRMLMIHRKQLYSIFFIVHLLLIWNLPFNWSYKLFQYIFWCSSIFISSGSDLLKAFVNCSNFEMYEGEKERKKKSIHTQQFNLISNCKQRTFHAR